MIIGVTGLLVDQCGEPFGTAGAGKDSFADALVARGFQKVSLADPLKEICASVFGWDRQLLWGPSALREVEDQRYPRVAALSGPRFLTPRYALQKLGTEWGRDCYPDIWVDLAFRRAGDQDVVIPDVRFANEVRAVRRRGGFVVRVARLVRRPADQAGRAPRLHPSEAELFPTYGWSDDAFDAVVENNQTLEALGARAGCVLQDFRELKVGG